jgi:hypothetical protein
MKSEALQLLKDLAVVQPLRHDLFSMALPLAKETQEVEHLQWVCTGIVGKAWPKEYAKIFDQAEVLAEATKIRLEKEGLVEESAAFADAVKNAKLRDLIVRVNWTGKADLDIRVQEPSGSVCSISNPVTLGGGVLVSDMSSLVERPSLAGYSEYYVCPAGFSGQYDILVRRVWGEVSGGKATVEIYTDYGTPDQNYISQEIDLGPKAALIQVAVKNGHRTEPIADAQLTGIRANQMALSNALSVKNYNSASSSSGSSESSGGSYSSGSSRADYNNFRQSIARNDMARSMNVPARGPVGYQPQITVVPEGAILFVTGVVSADRRYVRISPSPSFFGIGEIFTFNFVGGTTGSGGQGTGGFGGGGLGGGGGGGVGGGGGGVF